MAARREFMTRFADVMQEEREIGERLMEIVTNLQNDRDALRFEVQELKIERKDIFVYFTFFLT